MQPDDALGTQQPRLFKTTLAGQRAALRYLLYLPEDYAADHERRWPLILFLHGAGERGADLARIKAHGLPNVLEGKRDFPFVVVSPQCPPRERWRPDLLAALLDEIEATYRIDSERIYVTGLSMGGFGTWALAILQPRRFAAIAPVCGGGRPEEVAAIKHVPAWVFHGALDDIVPLEHSTVMVEALRAVGGDVRFTVYPDLAHDSWTPTYENPELYEWLLAHRRRPETTSE
jgi:predicted peptidase